MDTGAHTNGGRGIGDSGTWGPFQLRPFCDSVVAW